MKRIILVFALILASAAAHADAGSASMYPSVISPGTPGLVLNFNYSPGSTGISGGAVAVQMNPSCYTAPSLLTSSAGAISAMILIGGSTTNTQTIDPAKISIDGLAVTINALTLNSPDVLSITYGYSLGGSGVYIPGIPGAYPFNIFIKDTGAASNTAIDKQPVLYISNMVMDKSCSASAILAGNTFTYSLAYLNNTAGNTMTGLSVWDTLPPGISFLGSAPAPSLVQGNLYSWNIGSLSANTGGQVLIMARGNTGVASFGLSSENTASVKALNVSQVNYMSFSRKTIVQGIIMQDTITAMPDVVVSGGNITVVMNITNAGNLAAANIMPSVINAVSAGGGNAVLASGPVPASVASLAGNASAFFTWIFHATTVGTLNFSSHAYSDENGQAYQVPYATSNNVTVVMPTPTSTRTLTSTPAPTATNTAVQPAATNTAVVIVPTNTQVVIPTKTPVVVPTTQTPVIIPTSVSGGNVFTDKNYMRQDTGDRIRIYYEAPVAGKLEITVFNLNGERIRYLTKSYDTKTADYVDWDGKNDVLKPVGKGIYFVHVKMGKWQKMKIVVILK